MIEQQSLYTAVEQHVLTLHMPLCQDIDLPHPICTTDTIEELIAQGDPNRAYRFTVAVEALMDQIGPKSYKTHPYQQLSQGLLCELLGLTDKIYQRISNPTVDTESAAFWIEANSWTNPTADPILQALDLNHTQILDITQKLKQHYLDCGVDKRRAERQAMQYPANIALTLRKHALSPEAARFIPDPD